MAKYRWLKTNRSVLLSLIDRVIPCLPGHPEWEDYLAWVAAGGVTDPELPGTPEPDPTGLAWFADAGSTFSQTTGGKVPPPVTATGKFIRDDGTWAVPPSGGTPTWGSVTGTLSAQTDLQAALDAKQIAGSYELANSNIQTH